jgi:hypothetical protein
MDTVGSVRADNKRASAAKGIVVLHSSCAGKSSASKDLIMAFVPVGYERSASMAALTDW